MKLKPELVTIDAADDAGIDFKTKIPLADLFEALAAGGPLVSPKLTAEERAMLEAPIMPTGSELMGALRATGKTPGPGEPAVAAEPDALDDAERERAKPRASRGKGGGQGGKS